MGCLSKAKLCAVVSLTLVGTIVAIALVAYMFFYTSDTGDSFVRASPVSTDCGSVSGRVIEAKNGVNISTYRNIPYAVPPLKDLRWKPSTLLSEGDDTCWDEEFDGTTEEQIQCVNGSTIAGLYYGVEDCLVLSVRTPDVNGSRPVIIWIHGGGLIAGYGDETGYSQDEDYTEALDVVTVNINYRLGLMGFMTVEDFDTTGNYANYGLTDQVTALKWVSENIAKFGGNPNSVTILGNSGGGTAVLGLISSPLANNLFHKAIALSPGPFWNTTYTEANERYKSFVGHTGCDNSSQSERLECMQNLDIKAVWDAGAATFEKYELGLSGVVIFDFPMKYGYQNEPIGMSAIDPIVVPQAPKNLANALFIPKSKIKVIIANTAEEASLVAMEYGKNAFPDTTEGWESLESALKEQLANIVGDSAVDQLMEDMWAVYPRVVAEQTVPSGWTPQKAWDTLVTDLRFTCPLNNLVVDMKNNSNYEIYRLYITHAYPGFPSFHSWDTLALFGLKFPMFSSIPESQAEHINGFVNAIQKLVKDFAYDTVDGEWETYPTNSKVLTNSAPWSEVSDSVRGDECALWKENELDHYGYQN